jgi:Pvc16 N-terminal domain
MNVMGHPPSFFGGAGPRPGTREVKMADFGVIEDVSDTLVTALDLELGRLVPPAHAELNDLAGAPPSGLVLTVTLYEILEDPPSRNRPPLRDSSGGTVASRKPPMALLLRYLLTPWGGDQGTVQNMVGRAMQVLYDDAILDGLQLQGALQGSRDTLKVTLAPLSLEERTRVWWAIQKPYRLSLNYEIRVVNLDALAQRTVEPVRSRTLDAAIRDEP